MPEGVFNLGTNVYTSQLFQVKATGQTSDILEAKSGIRQCCLLSPYLCLVVHSMLLFDVDKQLLEGGLLPWVFSRQTPFYDLVYADDTALIAGTAQRAEQLFTLIENAAAHSNLQLNWEQVPPQVPFLTEPRLQPARRAGKGGGACQVPRGHPVQKWVKQKGRHRKAA